MSTTVIAVENLNYNLMLRGCKESSIFKIFLIPLSRVLHGKVLIFGLACGSPYFCFGKMSSETAQGNHLADSKYILRILTAKLVDHRLLINTSQKH